MKRIFILCLVIVFALPCLMAVGAQKVLLDDGEGLFSQNEFRLIEEELYDLGEKFDMDFVIVTSFDLDGLDAQTFADDYYDYSGYSNDGIILVLSENEGEVFISTSGKAIRYISDAKVDKIFDYIYDDLAGARYFNGVMGYLSMCQDLCDEYITAKQNEPFLSTKQIVICAVIGVIIGLIGVSTMKSSMKTVRSKAGARDYMVSGSLNVTERYDVFLFRNVTRTRRQSSSSGGNRTGSSGRSHGGSGRSFR